MRIVQAVHWQCTQTPAHYQPTPNAWTSQEWCTLWPTKRILSALALVKETPEHKSTSSVYVSPWQHMRAITDVNSYSRRYDKRNAIFDMRYIGIRPSRTLNDFYSFNKVSKLLKNQLLVFQLLQNTPYLRQPYTCLGSPPFSFSLREGWKV